LRFVEPNRLTGPTDFLDDRRGGAGVAGEVLIEFGDSIKCRATSSPPSWIGRRIVLWSLVNGRRGKSPFKNSEYREPIYRRIKYGIDVIQ